MMHDPALLSPADPDGRGAAPRPLPCGPESAGAPRPPGRARRRGDRGRLRRLCAAILAAGALATGAAPAAHGFGLDDVAAKAAELAKQPFREPKGEVPDWLLQITYDQWRDIRFRPDQALWRGKLPFEVQLFHPGLWYDRAVKINVVEADGVKPVPFSPSRFDYGKNTFASQVPQDLGWAGFRLHYPIKTPKYKDEVIVFLGASYFRALGRDHGFGLSARGLAIDTAESSGEEFPYFKEFWLERPGPRAKSMTLYALLDSPSATGAYRFVVAPGAETRVDVEARLFLRREVKKLGLAPLTSMYFHGENTLKKFEDFRPEVHDSDGLLVHSGTGEWIWRPLDNPRTLHVVGLEVSDPRGFGLVQRDRDFDHYQDLEARSELRPSAWIEPRGNWGKGRVELVEIPTKADINDNVVAYWVPDRLPRPGEPLAIGYTIHWYGDDPGRPPGGRVLATRRDLGKVEGVQRFVIDFGGKQLAAVPADQVLRGMVTVVDGAEAGELVDQQVTKNPVTGDWRLSFQVRPKTSKPIELRAFLDRDGDALTETWTYTLLP